MLSHEKPMQLTHGVKKFIPNTPFLSDNARHFLYEIAVVAEEMGGVILLQRRRVDMPLE